MPHCAVTHLESGYTNTLRYAAGLHDVGKVAIPDSILHKQGKLDPADWEVMRCHPALGFTVLHGVGHEITDLAASVALHHHECWDGSGYPDGLKGETIPREARIVGLCDVYGAQREVRPYKAPLTHEHAMHIILVGDGRTLPSNFDRYILSKHQSKPRNVSNRL